VLNYGKIYYLPQGGGLELSKRYHYLVHWHWDIQGYPKLTEFRTHLDNIGEHNFGEGAYRSLKITSGIDRTPVEIRNKSVKISSKILGVMVPVNKNNWEEEISRMTKKSNKYARLTMSNRHRHCDANLSHRII
jgi:hypothetical protein